MKKQLGDFGVHINTIPLMCDNASSINMRKNPVQHKRAKHINVRHHLLRDNVEKGNTIIKYCRTKYQIADIFIKSLSKDQFESNRLKLEMMNMH